MIHHSIAKKQGPKEGNSVRRVTRLAACLTAVSTLGAGLIMPITAVADDTASSLLVHRSQNVEKLADALLFRTAGNGIHPSESGPDKTGLRG